MIKAIATASVLEPLLKARGSLYDALQQRGVHLPKPETSYALTTLLNILLEHWDADREALAGARELTLNHSVIDF